SLLRERAARTHAEAAQKAARTEAVKSQQVATFLAGMLEGVKPGIANGRDTGLLSEMLDHTVKRLDTDFKEQPEVEAHLRLVVGQVYSALSLDDTAVHHLTIAWEMRRKLLGAKNPDTLEAELALADTLEDANKVDAAKTLASEALQYYREQFGSRDRRAIAALQVLGNALKRGGEFQTSVTALREVVSLKRALFGEDSPKV